MASMVAHLGLGAMCLLTVAVTVYLLMFAFQIYGNLAARRELTAENWERETAGKIVFVMFFAPWCSHCKDIKPDWDKLMRNWNRGDRARTSLVADVDCIGAGKALCDLFGVEGFPTIKWGNPAALEDYEGGRDYEGLEAFANEKLMPVCGPTNLDFCDEETKARIAGLIAMPGDELQARIEEGKDEINQARVTFEEEVKKLEETFQQLRKIKQHEISNIKASGLTLMLAVKSHAPKNQNEF